MIVICSLNSCAPSAVPVISQGGVDPAKSQAILPLRATIDLGVIDKVQSVELSTWIKNQSKISVQASKIESSCECLEVRLSQTRIAFG